MNSSFYKLRILSLGAGVQSSTILLMACKGLLPKPDAAIFADTGWETNATYQHLEWLKIEASKCGIPIEVVQKMDVRELWYSQKYPSNPHILMPIYVVNNKKRGMARRLCTGELKIIPIRQAIRKALGLRPRQWAPKDCVETWIGISTDEIQRVWSKKQESDRMQDIRFPLIELGMSRNHCIQWLWENYHIIVPKSACIGCPFHTQSDWRDLSADELRDACGYDRQIRGMVGGGRQAYLHRSCVPLNEVDFRTPEERGQGVFDFVKDEKLNLFVNNISIMDT